MHTFKQILPGVFHLTFDTALEVASHFLRAQEFYESPTYKGKHFQILDYVKWYAKDHDGHFTYFDDWSGFNVPASTVLAACQGAPDPNDHDYFMIAMAKEALKVAGDGKAYIIGTSEERPTAIRHEIAHALYYLSPGYRRDVQELIAEIPKRELNSMHKRLERMGYHPSVWEDEAQAFLSEDELYHEIKGLKIASRAPSFQKHLKKYC